MKNVLFDGTALQHSEKVKFHGGGDYAKYILKQAIDRGFRFDIVLSNQLLLDDQTQKLIDKSSLRTLFVSSKEGIYSLINNSNYDVFYSALPYNYFDYYSSNTKLIGVIHGLRPIEIVWDKYKHKYYKNKLKRFIGLNISKLKFVRKIIFNKRYSKLQRLLSIPNSEFVVVSNHTKYAILNYFPNANANNINVFYSPFDKIQMAEKNKSQKRYFLLVSGNRFEKNSYRVIKAIDSLYSKGRLEDIDVIITGAKDIPFISEIVNKNRFNLLQYVGNEELNSLYKNAYALVYPSLNEGFGYPPLFAMQLETPVVCSCATSIPEVCDCAALYFNPLSMDEIKNRLLQIYSDNNLYNKLVKKGKARVSELLENQEKSTEEYLNFIFN